MHAPAHDSINRSGPCSHTTRSPSGMCRMRYTTRATSTQACSYFTGSMKNGSTKKIIGGVPTALTRTSCRPNNCNTNILEPVRYLHKSLSPCREQIWTAPLLYFLLQPKLRTQTVLYLYGTIYIPSSLYR